MISFHLYIIIVYLTEESLRKKVTLIKLVSLDEMVKITIKMFNTYVEPLAMSLLSGEVPSTTLSVQRKGTRDGDWLSHVKFKNTLTISVFRCEVYLDDIMALCRKCNIDLVTKEIFQITVLFSMLHPLYQTEYMDFSTDADNDYDSMMFGASRATKLFIEKHYKMKTELEQLVLDTLYYNSFLFIKGEECKKYSDMSHELGELFSRYQYIMRSKYPQAYRKARLYRSYTNLIDEDGFIILERKKKEEIHYGGEASNDD